MPKIRRHNLPRALYAYLLERIQRRQISGQQLRLMLRWMDTHPEVPGGKWFKRFPEMLVCSEGELIKTFLVPGQVPSGEEIEIGAGSLIRQPGEAWAFVPSQIRSVALQRISPQKPSSNPCLGNPWNNSASPRAWLQGAEKITLVAILKN